MFGNSTILGKTGLRVGKLGVSSSFGAPAAVFEEAFDKGCNYFTWGAFIKGRSREMKKTIGNITSQGKRDELVIAMYSYAHSAFFTEKLFESGLKSLGLDYADILILGYFPKRPSQRIIDGALDLKKKGRVRFLGLSGHSRKLFAKLRKEELFDVFHVRYNAAHRGAETEVFPHMGGQERPGIISFTATKWRQLLNSKKMPSGLQAPKASDCYRFVLSNKSVDVCMMGVKNTEQLRENLSVLSSSPMTEDELKKMRQIGDHLHRSK